MSKILITSCLAIISLFGFSQNQLDLLGEWSDPTVDTTNFAVKYNELWGFTSNGKEYAVLGSGMGTHIIDIEDPSNLDEVAFIPGRFQGYYAIHRDYHDYKGYLYIVGDQSGQKPEETATLQIVDLRYLPDSFSVVYDTSLYFSKAHNVFIDSAKGSLYACSPVDAYGSRTSLMKFSIANPENPQYISKIDENYNAHDAYARNDTVYMASEDFGFTIWDYTGDEPELISQLIDYDDQGYNHSSWLTEDGKHLVMADETQGMRLKMVEIGDDMEMDVVDLFAVDGHHEPTIPHNPIIRGDYAFVSYYFDGLVIFDISDPTDVQQINQYDSYLGNDSIGTFEGAWGVYPFLRSGKLLLSDMDRGLLVFSYDLISLVEKEMNQSTLRNIMLSQPSITPGDVLKDINDWSLLSIDGKLLKKGKHKEIIKLPSKGHYLLKGGSRSVEEQLIRLTYF